MPGYDRTGPMGAGPMTGGARGLCNPAGAARVPGTLGYGYGRGMAFRRGFGGGGFGMGMGRGRGYGRGYGWYPPVAGPAIAPQPANELEMLKSQADYLQQSLSAIQNRIGELEGDAS